MGKGTRVFLIAASFALICACQEPVRQAEIPEDLPTPKNRFELNSVSLEELLAECKNIKGLNAGIARSIVEFRKDFRYRRVEDLLAVKGIGEKTFLRIRRNFYVEEGGARE